MPETRAEKAQRLVDEGRVNIVARWPLGVEARVQGEHSLYIVDVSKTGTFFCTCDWGLYRNYTNDLCAHALAVQLLIRKEN